MTPTRSAVEVAGRDDDAAFSKLPDLDLEVPAQLDEAARLRAIVAAMEAVSVRLRSFPSMLPHAASIPPTG